MVGRGVHLPRLGRIRLKEELRVQGSLLSATVHREANRWYVSLTVDVELPALELGEVLAVGIDVGLAHVATLGQDGTVTTIPAPKPLVRYLRLVRRR